jgi:hypothetical protein
MKNLTDKQQTIIADITTEFVKINEEKSKRKKGGLIDIDALLLERESDLDLRKSIELTNRINFGKFNQRLNDDANKLNEDLADFNLVARIDESKGDIVIETLKPIENRNKYIWIKYYKVHSYINFKSQIEGIYKVTDSYYIELGGNATYKSIEDVVKSENFNSKLRELINITITN